MRLSCIALALMFALPATARGLDPVVATNGERDSVFVDLADCQKALGGAPQLGKASTEDLAMQSGSLFNRAAGNLSRCELVQDEYSIVVYPKGKPAAATD